MHCYRESRRNLLRVESRVENEIIINSASMQAVNAVQEKKTSLEIYDDIPIFQFSQRSSATQYVLMIKHSSQLIIFNIINNLCYP